MMASYRPFAAPPGTSAPVRPEAGVLLASRYRLVERVGSGATSTVWRAHDDLLDREVGVKQFRAGYAYALAEARMAARVRHPNVVGVQDVVQHGDCQCLVMDYSPGRTLASLLQGGRMLPPPVVAGLGLELVAALRALHDAGIVHCDVKPANLMVDQDGGLVLVDLGIAELDGKGPAHPARQRGEVVGSPVYMAPELILGRPPRAAADLWSLGVTLYTAVEGRPPFPQEDPLPTLAAVLRDPPLPMRRAGRLQSILDRLLVKDPENRPRHDELRALLVGVRSSPPAPAMALGVPSVREPARARRDDADTLPFVA